MENTYKIRYVNEYLTVTAEIMKTLDEANKYSIKETGVNIEEFLTDCIKNNQWRFDDEESAEWAEEDICGILWHEAENYVDFNKENC